MQAISDYTYVGEELDLFQRATHWKSYFRNELRPFLGTRVLEVGAGTGGTTRILCDGTQQTWVCLEPDAKLASRIGPAVASGELPPCCSARVGSTESLASDFTFDTILYIDVLEHIEDDAAEVERAAQLLAPGGHLLALAPAHQAFYSEFDKSIGHWRRYNAETLAAIIPPSLQTVKLVYLDSVGLLASAGNKALLRQSMPTSRQIAVWDKVMVPISRVLDPILGHSLGKSVLGVWRKA